ncbi:MAG: hypothetical protein P8X86_14510 [Desulfofustis sp.]|jgi:hypothetical protein
MPYTTDSRGYNRLVRDNPGATRILAEGDSWFAYPRRYIAFGAPSNIVQILAERSYYAIYSTASIGDEVASMMTGEQKFGFTKRLGTKEFDIILFSGGGNDIVGRYDFDLFLKPRQSCAQWQDCIEIERLDNKLDLIESVYVELLERVLYYSLNPEVKVVSHNYDFCVPAPEGYELFDLFPIGEAWIYPFLMEKQFTNAAEQQAVIRFMLERFGERLARVEAKYPGKLFIAATQGTLSPNQWRNEIHPSPAGFRKIGSIIHRTIQRALQEN